MNKIQVLGSGCPTCKKLHEIVVKAVSEMKIDATIDYVTGNDGMRKMIELGAMESPVLTVNNKIAMTGYTPDVEVIKAKIMENLNFKN